MERVLQDKVALVTGGSRGIGKGIAARLAQAGAEVVLTARSAEAAQASADEIVGAGGQARGIALDISDDASVKQAVAELIEAYAKIPILVNNAGITCDNLLLRMKPGDWNDVLQTNLTGVYRLCRALVPTMVRARYGRIVNITSVVAQTGNPGQTNYAASKAGIEGFTRSLARELASRNITGNCVAPGFIDTDMTRSIGDAAREQLLAQVPLRRLGTAADVAAAVLFLVGPGGDYITGTFQVANRAFGSEVNFTSLFAQGSFFRPAKDAVIATSVRLGWNQPYGSTKSLPITERYFAGGSTTLRSFSLDEAGPEGGETHWRSSTPSTDSRYRS